MEQKRCAVYFLESYQGHPVSEHSALAIFNGDYVYSIKSDSVTSCCFECLPRKGDIINDWDNEFYKVLHILHYNTVKTNMIKILAEPC